jgi:6-phosphogluconolactonase
MNREVRIVESAAALFEAAAEEFAERARAAAGAGGRFRVALAGGSTPRGLYSLLASEDAPFRDRVPWEKVQVFWGDERAVPPDHRDSNYKMAWDTLLSRVPVPPANIHRIRAELPDARAAADAYESELKSFFNLAQGDAPAFDLILLGMGPDGHTASLFPKTDAVRETTRLVAAPWVEAQRSHRITLTPRAINPAARVLFLVSGEDKAKTLQEVVEGEERPDLLPAQAIRPREGALLFLADRAAAALLRS